jgi:hypothetical protein
VAPFVAWPNLRLEAFMKFRFPIVIIDEDFRSENTSGLGIRALAQAIEAEGFEVVGVTSYGDLSQFAQQQSRASAFILSIDDEEFSSGPDLDPAVLSLRSFIEEVRRKNAEVPIYIYGETKTSRHLPNDILRELHGFIHMFEDTPEFVARHIIREAKTARIRGTARAIRVVWRSSNRRWGRCTTSSMGKTCCVPTCATRWKNWGNCSTTTVPLAPASATRPASSTPTTVSS